MKTPHLISFNMAIWALLLLAINIAFKETSTDIFRYFASGGVVSLAIVRMFL